MKKQSGIWIDTRNAWIIDLFSADNSLEPSLRHIHSDIEEGTAKGGSRSKSPWGPQGGINENRVEERRRHEEKSFFEEIIAALDPETDELIIFGPSQAKHGLLNELQSHKHLRMELKGVESADHLSEPQMEAWVRKYFDIAAPRQLPKRS